MRRACSTLLLALLAFAPAVAHAHPMVDQARREFDATRHRRALQLLEQAEEQRDLSRGDLIELLLLRAFAHRALRQMDLAEVDMFRLAGLDPARELGREVPPQLRRLFEQARERVPGPVRIEVHVERSGEVMTVTAEVLDDVAALATGFRLFGRAENGDVRQSTDSRLDVTVLPNQTGEYWAELLGPGGAVIASQGSEDAPLTIDATEQGLRPGDLETGEGNGNSESGETSSGGGDEGIPAWPFVVGGVVLVLAAVAVVLAVVLTTPTDDTQLSEPTVQALVSSPLTLLTFD